MPGAADNRILGSKRRGRSKIDDEAHVLLRAFPNDGGPVFAQNVLLPFALGISGVAEEPSSSRFTSTVQDLKYTPIEDWVLSKHTCCFGCAPDAAQQHIQAHHESRMNKGSPLTLHSTDLQPGNNIRRGRMPSAFLPCLGFQVERLADKATTCPPEALCLL
jgi:hypothetical protein